MKKDSQLGFAGIFTLVGMLLVAISLPVATKLVEQNQENRSSAKETECEYGEHKCSGGQSCYCNNYTWKCSNCTYGCSNNTCNSKPETPVIETPTVPSCGDYTYTVWGDCSSAGIQLRSVIAGIPAGCKVDKKLPDLDRKCNVPCSATNCGVCSLSECVKSGCMVGNNGLCTTKVESVKNEIESKDVSAPGTTTYCTYTCDTWGPCLSSDKQACVSQTAKPDGCTGGVRVTTRECAYTFSTNATTETSSSLGKPCESNYCSEGVYYSCLNKVVNATVGCVFGACTDDGSRCMTEAEVKAKDSGESTITATTSDGKAETVTLNVNDEFDIKTILKDFNPLKTYLESLNAKIATIGVDGIVKAITSGIANFLITTNDGKSENLTINVVKPDLTSTCSSTNCGNCSSSLACSGAGCKWAGGACMPYTVSSPVVETEPAGTSKMNTYYYCPGECIAVQYPSLEACKAERDSCFDEIGCMEYCALVKKPHLSQEEQSRIDELTLTGKATNIPCSSYNCGVCSLSECAGAGCMIGNNGLCTAKVEPIKNETENKDTSVPVVAVTVSGSSSVEVGQSISLTAIVSPDNATDKTIIWSNGDASVATVNANGIVTGKKAGAVTITAVASNGKYGSKTVTVNSKLDDGCISISDLGKYQCDYNMSEKCGQTENGFSWEDSDCGVLGCNKTTGQCNEASEPDDGCISISDLGKYQCDYNMSEKCGQTENGFSWEDSDCGVLGCNKTTGQCNEASKMGDEIPLVTKKTCSGGDGNKKCEDQKMYYCDTNAGLWVFASECANGTVCDSARTACVANSNLNSGSGETVEDKDEDTSPEEVVQTEEKIEDKTEETEKKENGMICFNNNQCLSGYCKKGFLGFGKCEEVKKESSESSDEILLNSPKLSFKITFEGISPDAKCVGSLGKLNVEILNKSTDIYKSFLNIGFSAVGNELDSKGNQVFQVTNLEVGDAFASVNTFNNVKVKGPFHLKRRMCLDGQSGKLDETTVCNIDFTSGKLYDFSEYTLLAGDVNQDGMIDAVDYSLVKNAVNASAEIECGRQYDLNLDGVVNALDLNLVGVNLSLKDE
jgi:uncharacterized protein YjdB